MNYYDSQENKDINYLTKFNNYMGWFTEIIPTKQYDGVDANAVDVSGRTVTIEHKERYEDYKTFKYKDIYIEPKKLHHLTQAINRGNKALYINYFNDGNVIVIFDMSKQLMMKYYPHINIYDKGDGKNKKEARLGISKYDALVYQFNPSKNIYEKIQ